LRRFSHFNVIESIRVLDAVRLDPLPANTKEAIQQSKSILLTSVWMRTDEDRPEDEYEYQIAIIQPQSGEAPVVSEDNDSAIANDD